MSVPIRIPDWVPRQLEPREALTYRRRLSSSQLERREP